MINRACVISNWPYTSQEEEQMFLRLDLCALKLAQKIQVPVYFLWDLRYVPHIITTHNQWLSHMISLDICKRKILTCCTSSKSWPLSLTGSKFFLEWLNVIRSSFHFIWLELIGKGLRREFINRLVDFADLGLRVCVESSTYFHMSSFETMTLFRTKNPKIHTLFRTTPSILLSCLCRQYPVHN